MFPLVGYALLFVVIGVGFILIHLLIGKLVRPNRPHAEKETIYECGEPTIGSAWVQFDLRFYVVALLFVIFDVEVAFFFPWAVVFGKANALANPDLPESQRIELTYQLSPGPYQRRTELGERRKYLENHLDDPGSVEEVQRIDNELTGLNAQVADRARQNAGPAHEFAWLAFWDIVVFFGVLLVGFAYLWRRGDLAWVRSISSETATPLQSVVKTEKQPLVGAGSGS
jgi:NADH-quinone oxidoreductase subunit A